MTSAGAAHPQRLIPINQAIDLRPLLQRCLFHQADESIGVILRFDGNSRSLASIVPARQRPELHAVSDEFAVDGGGLEHGGNRRLRAAGVSTGVRG